MIKQQHSIKCPTESMVHEQNKLNINTPLLAQASNCTRRSAPLRESSWCIQQPSMSQPGWPSPWFFRKVSKVSLPTIEKPHPRCPCHSSSCWKGSSQKPQRPALSLITLRIQSALHLRLSQAPSCTAAMAGICMQAAFQPPTHLSSIAAAQEAPCQSLPMSPTATYRNLLLLHLQQQWTVWKIRKLQLL